MVEISDEEERRYLMSLPKTQWYREQVESVEDLVIGSPMVEVLFDHSDL